MSGTAGQPESPRERTPPWTVGAKSDRTREQILDGARLVFQELGYATTRVEQIAKRAGVSRPTFYVYFASKRDAFFAVAERSVEQLRVVLDALADIPQQPEEKELVSWVAQMFEYFDAFGAFATVWRQAAFADDELRQSGWQAQKRWGGHFGRGIERIRGKPLDDPVAQGLAIEALLESLWFSSTMRVTRQNRQAVVNTAAAMLKAFLG